jgi:hypothetical protein
LVQLEGQYKAGLMQIASGHHHRCCCHAKDCNMVSLELFQFGQKLGRDPSPCLEVSCGMKKLILLLLPQSLITLGQSQLGLYALGSH